MNASQFRREIVFTPAWDKRDPDPKKNYGVHGVVCYFYLHGPDGVVQFVIFTNWMTPEVQKETDARAPGRFPYLFHEPLPADVGYHSPRPMYEDQRARECTLLGGSCYYDGSSLAADDMMDVLRREGSDGVWRELEAYYRATFTAQAAA